MKTCSVTGCPNKYRSIGLCSSHWKINKKYGTPTPTCWCGEFAQTNGGKNGGYATCVEHSLADRFWEHVDIKTDEECWEWTGSKTTAGYGHMYWDGEQRYAHRLSIELSGRDLPKGWHACHTCDNPGCVNPQHLFPGTPRTNVQDMVSKQRHYHGDNHHNAKIKKTDVVIIRQLAEDGVFLTRIAEQFGVTSGYISEIVSHRKRHIG